MRNNYILIGVISAVVLAAIIYAFTLVGFPVDARGQAFDDTRVSNLRDLKYQIEAFTQKTYKLPATLQEVKTDSPYVVIKDPETNKEYEYYPSGQSTYSYKLCATFSTSSESANGKTRAIYSYDPSFELFKHPKGNQCFEFTVQLNAYNNPYVLPTVYLSPTPYEQPTPLPRSIDDANIADMSTNVAYNEKLSVFPAGFFSTDPDEYGLINYHDEPVTITVGFRTPVTFAEIDNTFSNCTDTQCYVLDIVGTTNKGTVVSLAKNITLTGKADSSISLLKVPSTEKFVRVVMTATRIGGPDNYVHWKKIKFIYK